MKYIIEIDTAESTYNAWEAIEHEDAPLSKGARVLSTDSETTFLDFLAESSVMLQSVLQADFD